MKKMVEVIRRRPYATGALVIALGVGALEAVGCTENRTYDRPGGTCASPVASSGTFVDRGANLVLQTYTGIATTGVVAEGEVPVGVWGMRATFKNPDAPGDAWDEHASRMIKPDDAGQFALKMAIGDGEVQFGVQYIAPIGSSLCGSTPAVEFTYLDRSEYLLQDGKLPWPNPVNAAVNVLG